MNNPSLVLITESWLNREIPDSAVAIGHKFQVYRHDRQSPGGGVLAYVDVSVPVTRITNLEDKDKEVLWLLLKPQRTPRPFSIIIVVGVYYPPGQTVENEKGMNEYLTKGLDTLLKDFPSAGVFVVGDFNQMKLNILCNRFNLKKVVRSPTRGGNMLDQILTNIKDLYNEVAHLPPVGRSDQCLLYHPRKDPNIKPMLRTDRLMKPSKLKLLGAKLDQEEWKPVYDAQDVDDKVDNFTLIAVKLLDDALPETTIRVHSLDKPWMTPYIKKDIKARQRAFTSGNVIKHKELCEKVLELIKRAKKEYYPPRLRADAITIQHDGTKTYSNWLVLKQITTR